MAGVGCCHRVLEDALPLRKRQVRTQEDTVLLFTSSFHGLESLYDLIGSPLDDCFVFFFPILATA